MARQLILAVAFICAVGMIVWSAGERKSRPAATRNEQVRVALPRLLQLLLAGGDRYLAANISVFRATMIDSNIIDAGSREALASIQRDAAIFNAAHEDNYYIATATLPWMGDVGSAQDILQRAMKVRVRDVYPAFFYGFNRKHFFSDAKGGADYLLLAAQRASNQGERDALTAIAARWYERSEDLAFSRSVLLQMAKQAKNKTLQSYLNARAQRVQSLLDLREATEKYRLAGLGKLSRLEQLVSSGMLDALPSDPVGNGFSVNAAGRPVFAEEMK